MPQAHAFILTKIIATLGPATAERQRIRRLVEEGARVFRINFSHGTFEQFDRLLSSVRDVAAEMGVPVGVFGDLSGPKIRLGKVQGDGIHLTEGTMIALGRQAVVAGPATDGQPTVFDTTAPTVLDDIQPGERLYIDDGNVRTLVVDRVGAGEQVQVLCRVTSGGRVSSAKGINLPDSTVALPSVTAHDERCARWAVERGLDFLALSFVRRAADVGELKQRLSALAPNGIGPPPVIAKIEKPQALEDLDAILDLADAVMVARGDLGVEMDVAEVPRIQKQIIGMAHDVGKPVIVATQMLQSMIDSPSPTRAEVSDVANAIYDGADAVMLSGETAVGRWPVLAVATMARVARLTLRHLREEAAPLVPRRSALLHESRYRTAALAHGVATIVRDLDAAMVVTWSESGGGARYLSKNRLTVPIIAASGDPAALRRMSLLYGVMPLQMPVPSGREAFAAEIDRLIQHHGWARPGDPVVLVAGEPLTERGVSNTVWVRYVGDAQ